MEWRQQKWSIVTNKDEWSGSCNSLVIALKCNHWPKQSKLETYGGSQRFGEALTLF